MGVSVQQWRAVIGCWCRGGSVTSQPMSDVVGTARYQAVPLLLLAALLAISGVESNPGPQEHYMFNSELRDALRKLKEEMEQLKTAMEQQTSVMEQRMSAMEQQMEQKNRTIERLTMAMEQLTDSHKTMEHQMNKRRQHWNNN